MDLISKAIRDVEQSHRSLTCQEIIYLSPSVLTESEIANQFGNRLLIYQWLSARLRISSVSAMELPTIVLHWTIDFVTLNWVLFCSLCSRYQSFNLIWRLQFQNYSHPGVNELMYDPDMYSMENMVKYLHPQNIIGLTYLLVLAHTMPPLSLVSPRYD